MDARRRMKGKSEGFRCRQASLHSLVGISAAQQRGFLLWWAQCVRSPLELLRSHFFPAFHLTRLAVSQQPLVGSSGLEPPTSRLSGVRSNHLSYEPMSSSAALASAGRPAARPFPFCTLGPSASSRPRLRFTFPASRLQCNWWRISTWWR